VQPGPYDAAARSADDALMRDAWARGLTTIGGTVAPRRDTRLRVVTQANVASDGVAEAGLPADAVKTLFTGFDDVEFVLVDDLLQLDAARMPRDGRLNLLVSNQRRRYASHNALRPDLHLVLWNPFQVLDIPAPAVVTWGYAEGAIDALRAWLEGRAAAPGHAPVPLAPPTKDRP